MASVKRRLPKNAPGDFYVDTTCIDCGTCRWIAPDNFADAGDASYVCRQPATAAETHRSRMALLACPTASIGTMAKHDPAEARSAFPELIDRNVYHCGYHSPASYGAASYLIVRPEGNVLVDSPRFAKPLVRRIEELGGVATMFLTHRDDVADHRRFQQHFGCRRVLHADDVSADTADVEVRVRGHEPVPLAADLLVIPVPGHTQGSAALLHRKTHLFTGDHMAWDPDRQRLYVFRDACWYDWGEVGQSMLRLSRFRFEWVLPGHERRVHLPAEAMAAKMRDCLADMRMTRRDITAC